MAVTRSRSFVSGYGDWPSTPDTLGGNPSAGAAMRYTAKRHAILRGTSHGALLMHESSLSNIQDVSPGGPGTRPDWLKVSLPTGSGYRKVSQLTKEQSLHTVCQSAHCPNIGECWGAGTATFMILGNICTRSCGFCAVLTGRPLKLDEDEPRRVAESVRSLNLKHAVITSVNRDELPDGGATIFAHCIEEVRRLLPTCNVEVLIPDFRGNWDALQQILNAKPYILNHNTETVPRLYQRVRPQARYERSLELLRRAKQQGAFTKTGIMIGIGEKDEEILQVMRDLRDVDCDVLTIGQYLQPTRGHLPVERYVHPDKFVLLRRIALEMGFRYCESGALVRSSYHAEEQVA
jgi:lipoic acid synthetase